MESVVVNATRLPGSARWDYDYNQAAYLEFENLLQEVESVSLQDLCQQAITKGETPLWRGDKYVDEGVLFIRSENIREYGLDLSNKTFIPPHVHERMKRSRIRSGDVLLAIVGATIGQVAVVPPEVEDANSNQAVAIIRPKEDINPHYLSAVLQSNFGQTQIHHLSGGTARPNLDLWEVRVLQIPLVDRPTQDRIAAIMQEAYITRRAMLAEVEELLGGIDDYVLAELGIDWGEIPDVRRFAIGSTDLLGGRFDVQHQSLQAKQALQLLRESGHTLVQLGDIIELIHYGASIKNEYFPEGIPFIRISNLKPNELDTSDIVFLSEAVREQIGKAFVEPEDLLMSRSGSIGIVSCVPPQANGFAFGSYQIKFRLRAGTADPKYIAYVLNSPLGWAQTQQQKTGAVQMNITIPGIKAIRVPIPDADVQRRIVQTADNMRHKARELQRDSETVVAEGKAQVERMILGEVESDE